MTPTKQKNSTDVFDMRRLVCENFGILGSKINRETGNLCNEVRSAMLRGNPLDIQYDWEDNIVEEACEAIRILESDIFMATMKFNHNPAWRNLLALWLRYGQDDDGEMAIVKEIRERLKHIPGDGIPF